MPEHLAHNELTNLYLSVTKAEILTLSAFTIVLVLTMAKICTISDESDTSGDQEDTEHIEASHSHLAVPQTSQGELVSSLGPVGSVQKHSPVSVSRIHKAYSSLDKNMLTVFVSKESKELENSHTLTVGLIMFMEFASLSLLLLNVGEQMGRSRNFSINEEDFQEATDGKFGAAAGEGDSFRRRTRSAPPAFWAAKKYGRELRKMSDEFDTLFDKGVKKKKKNI